jgi:rhamnulokinase
MAYEGHRLNASVNIAAVDLGAESGRVMLGRFDGTRLALEEAHRFANVPVRVGDTLHWNVLQLWTEIQQGLVTCGRAASGLLASVDVDTWAWTSG